ncbi:pseudouridine synthase [Ectobacillus sp. JY-23]|uniref:pseudouridine synthase n=1 Tax=Ectobacillus sp. JY-23 TaxID=2933872 RepID=UPI001FF6CF02|nr:pseudouridine synthase [Ectobacillus sp. JY-23]UOY91639.1 pseudouridine synthase [Ectobacillus sp. JY-23]
MRIQKYVSEAGIYPRREIERMIRDGRITINGTPAHKNSMLAEEDMVLVDGKPLVKVEIQPVYIALYKPVGITCTAQSSVKENIIDFMNYPERIFPVGRLDKDSEGLIIMTNDGSIVNRMMHSSHEHEKEYIVTVDKPFDEAFLQGMAAGVPILNTVTKPCIVSRVDENVFRIILTQGLNRQIRRMCKVFGYRVTRLKRIRIINIHLGELQSGKWRYVTESELSELMYQLEEDLK